MAYPLKQLRELSDDQLVAEHDVKAKFTTVGTSYYVEELDRRSRERAMQASHELARASMRLSRGSFWLGVASTILSTVASVAAVLALFLR